MGEITIPAQDLGRLLADSARPGPCGVPYQRTYASLAATHRGRPVEEILPQLQAAAVTAGIGFTADDLAEQAEAIQTGGCYELRIRVSR
ncbi:hypothetical protein [Streptomyces cinereoruber]|uniref:hypothetical protein n=1 Tax=Streptomyces cinereoruber TaxID=67260 RepID=UPI00363D9851